ncbi:MAG: stage 0 sporulation family protein [Desulfobacteraceae bacterium]|nr:stage 0 sporulation family protein [Desulfobacteraceae bacterium]
MTSDESQTTRKNKVKVVGIRFKPAGKIYDFNGGAYVLKTGDEVLVETEHGLGFGTVATPPESVDADSVRQPLKKIYRPATDEDRDKQEKNSEVEEEAYEYCRECIDSLGLEMHLFSVESNFDGSKLTFFFTADGRVDFRKLVKMLVKQFRTKIEMRQVGIRNQAKICGGVGRCGRILCCSSFMTKFDPVTIKMAKKQGLSLNPTKISGVCGRLMCCLAFEYQGYEEYTCQQENGDSDETENNFEYTDGNS